MQQTDLLVDVNLRHNFIGTGQIGQRQGQLRNPDHPGHILESAATDKIRTYRDAYCRNRHVVFLPAFKSTSGSIHCELLRLIFFVDSSKILAVRVRCNTRQIHRKLSFRLFV